MGKNYYSGKIKTKDTWIVLYNLIKIQIKTLLK